MGVIQQRKRPLNSSNEVDQDFFPVASKGMPPLSMSEAEKSESSSVSSNESDLSTQEEDDDEEEDFEAAFIEKRRLRVLRRKNPLPEIDAVYESDTSDEETVNTVGNIPMEWYEDYPHIGYDINGKKIMKPAQGDDLDKFLANMDDKDAWRSVYDKMEGKDVVLNKEELEILKRIQQHQFPDSQFDPYEPTIEWFSSKEEIMPISAAPEPKRRFIPSKWEASKILKIARAIKAGIIVPGKKNKKSDKPRFYDIWAESEGVHRPNHIPAPKITLPEHAESYNPPSEYILDEKEEEAWTKMDPEDRPHNYLPRIHSALRNVGAYPRFIQERFERCLDLYLAPRAIKQKLDIDPESLIPKLPSPKDLRPFPTKLSITFKGHADRIRTISADATGQWLASGADDLTVKVWEISSGRCFTTIKMDEPVMGIEWNPNKGLSMLAIATECKIVLVDPRVATGTIQEATVEIIKESLEASSGNDKSTSSVKWDKPTLAESDRGYLLILRLPKNVTSIAWHRKGDYFATVSPDANSSAVQIHQLSRGISQCPFKKSIGLVQKVVFHPLRPHLFVATQRSVRVYNLVKQELIRKLQPGAKWISSIDIHPGGDNVIIGTYDKRIHWFDMDLSTKPYKTLRYHRAAVRQVRYHARYPLFSSCSDDGSVLMFHGMVYNDLMQNPLIVPVKTLKAHEVSVNGLGVLDCVWHPTQPWMFSCGSDKTIKLFV